MGSYGNYVCVPLQNNYWWIPVVILQFLIVFAGCYSHCVFLRLVVMKQGFGWYTRMTFGFISLQMLIMLLTSTGAFLITLAHGKLIEDCEISSIEVRKWLLYVHSFGEYFFVVCELLGTIERVISTYHREFCKSPQFPTLFFVWFVAGVVMSCMYIHFVRISFDKTLFAIGFGSLTLMEVINGGLVFFLLYIAKRKYHNDKEAPLNERFEFSQSYTYSRCAAASVTSRVVIITYIYLKLAGFFDGDLDSAFFYVMNVFINLYCLVYPWTIMLCHRKIKAKIRRHLEQFFPSLREGKIRQEGDEKTLYTIDGKRMNFGNTEDHFNQLHQFWSISPLPSPKLPRNA